jgi:hypothetical protein
MLPSLTAKKYVLYITVYAIGPKFETKNIETFWVKSLLSPPPPPPRGKSDLNKRKNVEVRRDADYNQ